MAILPSFAGGGAERVTFNILHQLNNAKITKALVTLSAEGPLHTNLAPINHIDLQRPRLRKALFPLLRLIWDWRPDIVFSTFGHINLALLALRPLLPPVTKLLLREANLPSLSLPASQYPWLFSHGYRWLYAKADCLICSSERMRHEFIHDFRITDKKLVIVPNPIDVETLRAFAERPFRHPGPGRRFVAAGRLVKQKAFDRLLSIFSQLPKEDHLMIFGTGPDEKMLRDICARLKMANVSFMGFIDRPWSWFAGADAFVMPSRWEGMPNAALEALALGAPVIATQEAGGIAEVLEGVHKDSVRIAKNEAQFYEYLNKTEVRNISNIAPCLLPRRYWLAEAVNEIEKIIATLVPYDFSSP
ncbi:MAG: glycosyltransferase [Alphaproteobacteria bacterium]